MADEPLMACVDCGARLYDADQRTCPHCLRQLRVRHFTSEVSLRDFQQDRRDHHSFVEPEPRKPRRGLALAFAFSGVVLLGAAFGLVAISFASTSGATSTGLVASAVVPLGMAAGLLRLALRYAGGGS